MNMMAQNSRKTLVIGASVNPLRFSNICIHDLVAHQIQVEALGLKPGEVSGVTIQTGQPPLNDIHTVTLYIGPRHQPQYYDYILGLKPIRIIFNPGTWNDELAEMAVKQGIKVENECTLVMLSNGGF